MNERTEALKKKVLEGFIDPAVYPRQYAEAASALDELVVDLHHVQQAGHEIFERLGIQENRAIEAETRLAALSHGDGPQTVDSQISPLSAAVPESSE